MVPPVFRSDEVKRTFTVKPESGGEWEVMWKMGTNSFYFMNEPLDLDDIQALSELFRIVLYDHEVFPKLK